MTVDRLWPLYIEMFRLLLYKKRITDSRHDMWKLRQMELVYGKNGALLPCDFTDVCKHASTTCDFDDEEIVSGQSAAGGVSGAGFPCCAMENRTRDTQ